jgi:hypothetical protein
VSAPAMERLLARLYTDAALRRRFVAEPLEVARQAGLDAAEARAFAAIDREGLVLAARSYAHKRAGRARAGGIGKRLLGAMRRLLG